MIDNNFLGAYAIGLIVLFIILKLFYTPLKAVFKLCINALAGGAALMLLNFAGQIVGINIGINAVTSLIAGLLGIPGVSLMLILQMILF